MCCHPMSELILSISFKVSSPRLRGFMRSEPIRCLSTYALDIFSVFQSDTWPKTLWRPLINILLSFHKSYSGKENFVIIISFVRSSKTGSSEEPIRSDLLESVKRLNVAITRAKYKLILSKF